MNEATVSFYTREKKDKEAIYMTVRFMGQRLCRYSTGLQCAPGKFKYPATVLRDQITTDLMSGASKNIREKIKDYYKDELESPDTKKVVNWLNVYFGKRTETKKKDFFEDFKAWAKDTKIPNTESTRLSTLQRLETYCKTIPTYGKFTKDYINDFYKHLLEKGLSHNSAELQITLLKSFLNKQYRRGIHNNDEFKRYKISDDNDIEKTDTRKAPVFSKEEIAELAAVKPKKKKYELSRDLILIMFATGIRWSDLDKVFPKQEQYIHLDEKTGESLLSFVPHKTKRKNKKVYIPLPEIVKTIWRKYGQDVKIPTYSSMVYSSELLLKECPSFKDNERYKTFQMHSPRRSYLTHLYNTGKYNPVEIMQISGHRDFDTFLGYIGAPTLKNQGSIKKTVDDFVPNLRIA